MSLPENFIRGIPNEGFLQNGKIGAHLFYFDANYKREDGWCEQSINWHDDDSVVPFTLDQRKEDGEYQFKVGIAIVKKDEIDHINKWQSVANILAYERNPLELNRYHGNLLIKSDFQKKTMFMIAGAIALSAVLIPRDN
jgi:hypothetical protein